MHARDFLEYCSLDKTASKTYAGSLQLVVLFVLHVLNLLLQIILLVLDIAHLV
jgi:hypothetical protein